MPCSLNPFTRILCKYVDIVKLELGVAEPSQSWITSYASLANVPQQSKSPINARTCKHLKSLLGDAYEAARLKLVNPDADAGPSVSKKPSSKSKRKRGERDEDEEKPRSKKARQSKPVSKADDGEAVDESGGETSEDDTSGSKKKVPQLLLAVKWEEASHDPTGWWISEKLDGVRYIDFYSCIGLPRIYDLLQNVL